MASFARGAPPTTRGSSGSGGGGGVGALVADPRFQDVVQRSRSLAQKILQSIPDTHKSCVYTETLKLNSSENAKLGRMAVAIRLPAAAPLKVVSENITLVQSLRQMYDGLQLQQDTLSAVSPRLEHRDKVTELLADIRDLAFQINKMLKLAQAEPGLQPSAGPPALHLPGEYEVQVAAHLALVQLQSFGQDVVRCLRVLDRSDEDTDAES